MIRAALVDSASAVDVRLLEVAVAAPIDLASVSLGDPNWASEIANQDVVLLGDRAVFVDPVPAVTTVRARTAAAVVLVGTAPDDAERVALLLDAGADDVVVAPVDPLELGARIRGILRRTMPDIELSPVERIGCHIVSFRDRRAWNVAKTRRVQFSPIQWQVLAALLQRPGQTVEVGQLQAEIWGDAAGSRKSYVRQYIVQLRRKLEPDPQRPRHLLTDHGRGYRYER
jgi:two-component system, OmpR family, KDP operon response regulator KdpE